MKLGALRHSLVKGRTDVDFLLVTENSQVFDFLFCEAKAYTSWNKKQLKEKIDHIKSFASLAKAQNINANYYFLLFGVKPSNETYEFVKKELETAPVQINLGGKYVSYNTRFKAQRCDENKKQDINGLFWNRRRCP